MIQITLSNNYEQYKLLSLHTSAKIIYSIMNKHIHSFENGIDLGISRKKREQKISIVRLTLNVSKFYCCPKIYQMM